MHPLMKNLDLKYPIFQGGMAWVADGKLAAAVSNAGGLGIIGSGHAPAEIVAEEISIAKTLTNRPFGVNVMLLSPHINEVVPLLLREKVAVITTGAGNPAKFIPSFKEQGMKVIPVVPSVGLAKIMARLGVDGVIAEGMEAGGHIGRMTTMAMIPQIVDAVDIPVIAAGGIGDGRGVAASLMLGACGVQMGTRFLTALECKAHPNYKKAVLKAKDIDTVVTGTVAGHPARVLKNKMSAKYLAIEKEFVQSGKTDLAELEAIGSGSLKAAVTNGEDENSSFMAGQIAGLVRNEESCKDILTSTWQQARQLLGADYEIRLSI